MALKTIIREGDRPLLVTAHLRTGVGMDPPYSLDLAGILAARMRAVDRAGLDAEGLLYRAPLPDTTEEEASDMNLPLSVCATADDWHWLASCAIPVAPEPDPEPRMFYRTVDAGWAHRASTRPLSYHHPSKGPFRDVMMPSIIVTCARVEWRAVGDAAQVEALLKAIRFIGRRRATGEGGVLRWEVAEVEAEDPGAWAHCSDDGQIIRPCPEQCATELGLDYRTGAYAIRPPSWHPDRLRPMAMTPEPEEEWGDEW